MDKTLRNGLYISLAYDPPSLAEGNPYGTGSVKWARVPDDIDEDGLHAKAKHVEVMTLDGELVQSLVLDLCPADIVHMLREHTRKEHALWLIMKRTHLKTAAFVNQMY